MLQPLPRSFYNRDTVSVAKDLLGRELMRRIGGRSLMGIITEVEAYKGAEDSASHAHRAPTKRNKVMFGKVGISYVYFTYGNHYCLNVVAKNDSPAGAVLIRAAEPIRGVSLMRKNRARDNLYELSNGPGKLTKAFRISSEENGMDLTRKGDLYISTPTQFRRPQISTSVRIGVSSAKNKPWRFFISQSRFISKAKRAERTLP